MQVNDNLNDLIETRDKKVSKRRVIKAETVLCSAASISTLAAVGLGHYNMVSSINTFNDLMVFGGTVVSTLLITSLIKIIIKHHQTTGEIKRINKKIKNNIMQKYDDKELEQTKDYSLPQDYTNDFETVFSKPYADYLKLLYNRKDILRGLQTTLKEAKVLTKKHNENIEFEKAIIDITTSRYENYQLKLINQKHNVNG